ncbi:S-layer homology domain-containing protein [Fictibacillus phosphorivorans]|uniref:S-layer homology domain-containing protein n=1 Tax=Fictibacillus phosphorivorans TaxID=1221500 RepID=UPI00203C9A77|nr:S-layer homology domain-containing protein [Fictibacillus phosphorivorans]MCM3776155.1 S-layer homology domain-containing protein [Fictibacillus phosphorivorans]
MKKWFTLLLLPFVLLFSSYTASAADDITGHYFEKDMRKLIELGFLKGEVINGETYYKPNRDVTRAEFAAFLVRVLEAQNLEVINPKHFSDVKENAWYYRVVQQAAEMNIVNGTPDGKFLPDAPISREAMASMMNGAFEYKGIKLPEAELKFADSSKVQSWAALSVKRMVYAKIIAGYGDNTFRPSEYATRGTTSAFLVRMIDVLKNPPKPPVPNFYLAKVTKDTTTNIREYETYNEAKAAATDADHVVLKDNKVVYMKSGVVSPAQVQPLASVLYKTSGFGDHYYSLVAGTETEFLDAGETWVKVKFNNTIGYFKMNEATLHPTVKLKGASYFKAEDGKLTHYTYNVNTDTYGAFWYGSSGTLPNGTYKSKDGHSFSGNGNVYNMYQYFNVMPLYTKTSYTAEQLNDFVRMNKPESAADNTILENLGHAFKNVEEKYNVNAMYLLAHAIHESGWGTSRLAIEKKNLFGIRATDGSAYESGDTFKSYEACIEVLVKEYLLDPTSSYFIQGWKANGEVVGDKELGMNVRYASDPYWGQKIAGYMYRIDKYLGEKERNQYGISVTLTEEVNVRSDATANASRLYSIPLAGTPVLVLDRVTSKTNEGTWLQIAPKNLNGANYEKTFVYSHGGPYGTLIRDLPLAP